MEVKEKAETEEPRVASVTSSESASEMRLWECLDAQDPDSSALMSNHGAGLSARRAQLQNPAGAPLSPYFIGPPSDGSDEDDRLEERDDLYFPVGRNGYMPIAARDEGSDGDDVRPGSLDPDSVLEPRVPSRTSAFAGKVASSPIPAPEEEEIPYWARAMPPNSDGVVEYDTPFDNAVRAFWASQREKDDPAKNLAGVAKSLASVASKTPPSAFPAPALDEEIPFWARAMPPEKGGIAAMSAVDVEDLFAAVGRSEEKEEAEREVAFDVGEHAGIPVLEMQAPIDPEDDHDNRTSASVDKPSGLANPQPGPAPPRPPRPAHLVLDALLAADYHCSDRLRPADPWFEAGKLSAMRHTENAEAERQSRMALNDLHADNWKTAAARIDQQPQDQCKAFYYDRQRETQRQCRKKAVENHLCKAHVKKDARAYFACPGCGAERRQKGFDLCQLCTVRFVGRCLAADCDKIRRNGSEFCNVHANEDRAVKAAEVRDGTNARVEQAAALIAPFVRNDLHVPAKAINRDTERMAAITNGRIGGIEDGMAQATYAQAAALAHAEGVPECKADQNRHIGAVEVAAHLSSVQGSVLDKLTRLCQVMQDQFAQFQERGNSTNPLDDPAEEAFHVANSIEQLMSRAGSEPVYVKVPDSVVAAITNGTPEPASQLVDYLNTKMPMRPVLRYWWVTFMPILMLAMVWFMLRTQVGWEDGTVEIALMVWDHPVPMIFMLFAMYSIYRQISKMSVAINYAISWDNFTLERSPFDVPPPSGPGELPRSREVGEENDHRAQEMRAGKWGSVPLNARARLKITMLRGRTGVVSHLLLGVIAATRHLVFALFGPLRTLVVLTAEGWAATRDEEPLGDQPRPRDNRFRLVWVVCHVLDRLREQYRLTTWQVGNAESFRGRVFDARHTAPSQMDWELIGTEYFDVDMDMRLICASYTAAATPQSADTIWSNACLFISRMTGVNAGLHLRMLQTCQTSALMSLWCTTILGGASGANLLPLE